MRIRMGLHTGEARVAESGYVGMDVHRVARICAAAHGGQILLSDTTSALVAKDLPDGVSLRGLVEHRLKDLIHPHQNSIGWSIPSGMHWTTPTFSLTGTAIDVLMTGGCGPCPPIGATDSVWITLGTDGSSGAGASF